MSLFVQCYFLNSDIMPGKISVLRKFPYPGLNKYSRDFPQGLPTSKLEWEISQFIFRLQGSISLEKLAALGSRLWHYNLVEDFFPKILPLEVSPPNFQEFPNLQLATLFPTHAHPLLI